MTPPNLLSPPATSCSSFPVFRSGKFAKWRFESSQRGVNERLVPETILRVLSKLLAIVKSGAMTRPMGCNFQSWKFSSKCLGRICQSQICHWKRAAENELSHHIASVFWHFVSVQQDSANQTFISVMYPKVRRSSSTRSMIGRAWSLGWQTYTANFDGQHFCDWHRVLQDSDFASKTLSGKVLCVFALQKFFLHLEDSWVRFARNQQSPRSCMLQGPFLVANFTIGQFPAAKIFSSAVLGVEPGVCSFEALEALVSA